MPPPNEIPRPRPEPPRPPETPSGGSSAGVNPEIARAKQIIRELRTRDPKQRNEVLSELRDKPRPRQSLDEAREALRQAPAEQAEWFVKAAEDIRHSEKVALMAEEIARNRELAQSPEWLTVKALELSLSPTNAMTTEARMEVSQAIGRIRARVVELSQTAPEPVEAVNTFDQTLYGGEVSEVIPLDPAKRVYDEEHPDEDEISDPALIAKLREVNAKIRIGGDNYLLDDHAVNTDVQELMAMSTRHNIAEDQARLTVERLQVRRNQAAREYARSRGGQERVVRYKDIIDTIPETDRVENPEGKGPFTFYRETPVEDIEMILSGPEGEEEFFFKLVNDVYTMGRAPDRPSLPQEYRWQNFKDFIEWKYGRNSHFYIDRYEYIWKEMPRHSQIIKNLMFTPGDPRDKLRNIQFLTPGDFDHYARDHKFANYAISLYDETVRDVMSEKRHVYDQSYKELADHDYRELKRYRDLRNLRGKRELTQAENQELQELSHKVDIVGNGVMLWDEEILNFAELDLQINEMSKALTNVEHKRVTQGEQSLTEWEREVLESYPSEIEYRMGQKQRTFARDEDRSLEEFQDIHSGLSQIDIEVKERLRKYLASQGIVAKEWQLNRAIWASRNAMIGSGRVVAIGASMAVKPAYEFKNIVPEAPIGKYVMKSPAFEDLQRIVNPDLFQDRFGMGDQMGEVYRSFLRKSLLERKGYHFRGDPKYRRENERHLDGTVRDTREFLRQVEDETGINYTEMLLQGFFDAGGIFDRTGWRLDIGVVEARREKLLKYQEMGHLPADVRLDNQAIGVQLLDTPQGPGRQELLHKLMRRNPSVALQLLGEPVDRIFEHHHFADPEAPSDVQQVLREDREKFRRALSQAQLATWDRREYEFADVNLLSSRADFDRLLRPYLEREGMAPDRIEHSFGLLQAVERELARGVNGHASRLEVLASHDMPMTLTIADFNWADTDMSQTGTIAVDRRGRDMWAMARARDAWIMMHKPEFLTNRKPEETLKKLKEFREAMNEYTTGGSAERATYELARAWIEFNRNRLIDDNPFHWRFYPMWVPFLGNIMKAGGELDLKDSHLNMASWDRGLSQYILKAPLKAIVGDHRYEHIRERNGHWFEHNLEPLGKKIAQQVSYGVRYGGAEGNAWEETDVDHVLDKMLEMGIFNADEALYHKLRREFKAGIGMQLIGILRRYWWLIPIVAAGLGLKRGLDEEEKSRGH
ncbi:hypothetical protein A2Z33_07650 [Candidatus Gottesmanbacteria bacterium RBG_16_52_11]|uniref:Large polyvalent protein associated domain-containing protein n=1 Tax=Candidatus Gottesmanbacteria bacterium RBG_16_52_11 TaxID=1798374 RepID=A0A1F5YNL6_9BACT|nr:MAG: hypothetical protein A2Z33_07650 [Candidatus Gottesmanbacteria bacterium RBG_16_52_11]